MIQSPHVYAIYSNSHHIHVNQQYQKILNSFITSTANSDSNTEINSKSALLSELGVLPDQLEINSVDPKCKLSLARLANYNAQSVLCTELFPVNEYITNIDKRYSGKISRSVTIYVDPSIVNSNTSKNGMCFVTRFDKIDPESSHIYYKFIILAVEEFEIDDISPTSDACFALAKCLISTLSILTRLYNSYFRLFYVYIEANAIGVDRIFYLCKEFYKNDKILMSSGITVLFSLIPLPSIDIHKNKDRKASRRAAKKMLKEKIENIDNDTLLVGGHIGQLTTKNDYNAIMYKDALLNIEHHNNDYTELDYPDHCRIGFILGRDKCHSILRFFSQFYQDNPDSKINVVCSSEVWSYFLLHEHPIPS